VIAARQLREAGTAADNVARRRVFRTIVSPCAAPARETAQGIGQSRPRLQPSSHNVKGHTAMSQTPPMQEPDQQQPVPQPDTPAEPTVPDEPNVPATEQ
jgi:hypothetical protein